MPTDSDSGLQIPVEVRDILWRIFGPGASPMSRKSAFHLIEPVIRKRSKLPRSQQSACVAEIRSWFQTHGDNHWLVADMREAVAQAIVEGVGTDFSSDAAIWAIAAVDSHVILPLLRARWSSGDIRAFACRAVAVIQNATEREQILDPLRASGYLGLDPAKTTVPLEAIVRDSHLGTFRHLGSQGWELVHHALDAAVSNLVELLVDLDPSQFESLAGDLDHPVLQALAAEHFVAMVRPTDHRATLTWVHPKSSDSLLALAVYHTLQTVYVLDDEPGSLAMAGAPPSWRTDLRPDRDDFAAAAHSLVEGLVDRICALPPKRSARWLGELLSAAPEILHGNRDRGKPQRVKEAEVLCTERLSSLLAGSLDDDVLEAFRAGLSLTPRFTWTRHIADLAWAMRTDSAAGAQELAQSTLDHHEQQIQRMLSDNQFFIHWGDWHHRDWTDAMGRALLLANPSQSPDRFAEWVRIRCFGLPLTIWDAEERYATFLTADRVAQHWLLLAVHAVRYASTIGQPADPKDVHALSDLTHTHCHFTNQRGCLDADVPVTAEAAARMTVDLGEVQDAWLIQEAASKQYSSRALWAFADQYTSRRRESPSVDPQCADFADKFGRAAASRFGDATQYSLDSLRYWSLLWLLLKVHGPAEQTAAAIAAATSQPRKRTRATDILFLKLFALATLGGRLAPELERRFIERYRHLWLPYTPDNELADRAEVDGYLRQSASSFGVAP